MDINVKNGVSKPATKQAQLIFPKGNLMEVIEMKGNVTLTAFTTLVVVAAMLIGSNGWAAGTRQIWLANSPILTLQNDAGGYSIDQRVNDLQLRANDLLAFGKNTPTFTVMKSGRDAKIYADKEFLMTVTAADAQANGTTPMKLARYWAAKFHSSIPQVISLYSPSGVEVSNIEVPRKTVIAVALDSPISSATSKVGDNFYAYQTSMNGGFPKDTRFTGRIESVIKANGRRAGQLGISFVSAKLIDGTRLPLSGKLISLDDRSARLDMASGRLISVTSPNRDNRFIASGAGAGLAIGRPMGNRPFVGAVLGSGSNHPYNQQHVRPAIGKNVHVASGTGFGIVLSHNAMLPDTTPKSVQ